MKTITAAIVDDEQDGREYIALLLANEFPGIRVILEASSVEEALAGLRTERPDIIFLDIQLIDGTGFDLLANLELAATQLIFITAYEQYALRAIKTEATDYILKPVEQAEFVVAVNKALKHIVERPSAAGEPSVNLPSAHGFRKVLVADIIRCEADSNYTTIYLVDKTKVIVSRTLFEFEKTLTGYGFFRIHHKHLINLKHFREYRKNKSPQALMSDGSLADISTRRKNDFMKQIGK